MSTRCGSTDQVIERVLLVSVFAEAQIGPNFLKRDPRVVLYDRASGLHGDHILTLTKPVLWVHGNASSPMPPIIPVSFQLPYTARSFIICIDRTSDSYYK
jgi:hypothetical protein